MGSYVALLRGINVGGKNLIKMKALVDCFEKNGYAEVATYIQSGNVLFESSETAAALTKKVEAMLEKTFSYRAKVVLRNKKQMREIVDGAPKGFGKEPAKYRYDVLFLMPPLTSKKALPDVPIKEGVDEAHAGSGVLYFSRLISKATQSRLSKVASLPIYQSMTIRNWNTTMKLLEMIEG